MSSLYALLLCNDFGIFEEKIRLSEQSDAEFYLSFNHTMTVTACSTPAI